MARRKVPRIILFLCSIITTAKCQKTAFSDFSESGNSYVIKNTAGAGYGRDLQTNCTLRINEESKHFFSLMILHYKYNFVYLELEFNNFSITESEDVIEYKRWVWTYEGDKGGYENLRLPTNNGYLSFGLLWTHTFVRPMGLNLSGSGTCNNLTSGNKTDAMISGALGDMTNEIASYDDVYNASYWCYHFRIKETGIIKFMCENFVCPHQTFEFRCCKYKIDFVTKTRRIICNIQHHNPGKVWWTFAIYLGYLCWVSYPLLLTYICYKLTNANKPIETDNLEMDNVLNSSSTKDFVFLSKHSFPITFLGTIKQALCVCHVKNTILSRLLRFMIIFAPLAILVLRILLALKYEGNFIQAAISKGSLLHFNNLLVDFQSAKSKYLVILGGPHVALTLFILLSCFFIQLPRDLESFLVRGLFNFESLGLSPLTLGLETKCRLAGLKCNDMTGFHKIHYTLSSNFLLLLNIKFWQHTFKMFFYRWKMTIYPFLKQICSSCLLKPICIPMIIGYVIFCIFELAIMLLLYLFPIVGVPLILCKAYVNAITDFCKYHSNTFVKAFCYIVIPFTVLALSFTWYIHCLVIFNCIQFFIIIILYTYSGVIAYPRTSYGYLILVFMTIYYTIEILNKFSKSYQTLLHVTIKASKNVNHISTGKTVEIQNNKGIPKKLWELIVERHQARRLNVASTLFQLAVLISVLYVSVDLLERFNQFQELSVITHVFTV